MMVETKQMMHRMPQSQEGGGRAMAMVSSPAAHVSLAPAFLSFRHDPRVLAQQKLSGRPPSASRCQVAIMEVGQ